MKFHLVTQAVYTNVYLDNVSAHISTGIFSWVSFTHHLIYAPFSMAL